MVLALGALLMAGCRTVPEPVAATGAPEDISGTNDIIELKARLSRLTSSEKRVRAQAHYAAGLLRDLNDDHAQALTEYYRAALYDPGNEELILETTRQLQAGGQADKALDLLLLARDQPDASGVIYARLGLVYIQLGRTGEAIEASRTAIRKSPRELAGYHNLYFACLQARRPADALKALDEAAKQTGADAEFLLGVADFYGNYVLQFPTQKDAVRNRAVGVMNRVMALQPGPRQLRLKLADDYVIFGCEEQAAALYRPLAGEFDDMPPVRGAIRFKLAQIYLRANQYEEAAGQFRAIIDEEPANSRAYLYLGGMAYDQQKWAEAVGYLQKAIILSPGLEQAYYDLVASQMALGKAEDALVTLDTARQRFPQRFLVEYLSALAQTRVNNYQQATANFTAAEILAQTGDTNRLTPLFYFQFGAALERRGEYGRAEKYFDKSLQLAPDFADCLNYLGYMWAEHGTNLVQARDLIERALKLEPKNPAFLDSMAWVLFQLGQPGPALDYQLKAVELAEGQDETLYDHLGDIYAALKQMDKARECWRKSLAIHPDDAVRKKLDAAGPE